VIYVSYHGARVPLESAIYESLFASWLSPVNASLAFALCFVGLWYGILLELYRRKIFLKV
jgi:predicted acyltransferase